MWSYHPWYHCEVHTLRADLTHSLRRARARLAVLRHARDELSLVDPCTLDDGEDHDIMQIALDAYLSEVNDEIKATRQVIDELAPLTTVERRPWPRHPGYLVGSDGTIVGPSGRLLIPVVNPRGYLCFSARIGAGTGHGRPALVKVHVAVCETFHGPRPPGYHAAHDNGIKSDCSAENILWKTPAENEADKIRHNTGPGRI